MSSRKKVILASLLLVVVLATSFLYFIGKYRAELTLEKFVNNQSQGKLQLHVDKVKFSIIHLRFDFIQVDLTTIDSSKTVTGYHIKAEKISTSIKALFSFLYGKQIIIESLLVQSPEIEVFKYLEGPKTKISLPEELGKVYHSLEKVLSVLYLDYLHIDKARFVIYDRSKPDTKPLTVSNINLTVDKVNNEKGNSDNRFLFADRIVVEITNQDILLPDGLHGIKFKKFWLGTRSQRIKLDSCTIYGKPNDTTPTEFSTFIDSLRIKKIDFNLLVNNGIIKMDSALYINPEVNCLLPVRPEQKSRLTLRDQLMNNDSLDFMLKKILGNLDIGFLTVKNAKVKIVTKKGTQSNVFNTENSNFTIKKLVVNSDPKIPIQLNQLNLQLHNYKNYSPDSMYVVAFDDILVNNRKISLNNFRIGPTKKNHEKLSYEIKMTAFEFNDINWPILLYENRIVAGRIVLFKPVLNFKLPAAKKKSKENKTNPLKALHAFQKKIQIDGISIEDGSMNVDVLNGTHFSVNHFYAGIGVDQLLKTTDVFNAIDALDTLSFSNGEFNNPTQQFLLEGGHFSKHNRTLKLGRITERKSDNNLLIKLNDIALSGIDFSSPDSITVSALSWQKADLMVNSNKTQNNSANNNNKKSAPKITIGRIAGGPTLISFIGNNFEASMKVNQISTDKIVIQSGKKPSISGLHIDGQSFNLKKDRLKSTMSEFQIHENQKSSLSNVEIRIPMKNEIATITIPKLIFSADISKCIQGNLVANYIELYKPVISFQHNSNGIEMQSEKSGGKLPVINIKKIVLDQPKIENLPSYPESKMHIDAGNSNFNFLGIKSDGTTLIVDSIQFLISKPAFENEKMKLVPTGKESIKIAASKLLFRPGTPDNKSNWAFNLDAIKTSGIWLNMMQSDTIKQTIVVDNLNISKLNLNSNYTENLSDVVRNNAQFRLSNGNITIENKKSSIKAYNLTLDKSNNSMTLDSLGFAPVVDYVTFMKDRQYRKSYMRLYTGQIKAKGIDYDLLVSEKVINSKKITINDLRYLNYVDKRLPFEKGIIKPKLTELIKRIKTKLLIDSLILKNSQIVSEEINDKTLQEGKIYLTKIRGGITGIRNYDFEPNDSLRFNFYARLLDTAEIRVNYKQSYTDSLSSFHLKAIVNAFDLKSLNPILKPFASARVKSGYLDTIRMSVVGRKYVAFGIMKMYYHDLNVEYLNKGSADHKTMKTKMISFFANRIVHKNNRSGSGEVYAERDQQKSFVNFWVKIFIGGVLTNTGVRTDRKQEKKYTRSIKEHHVPPISNIPVDY